MVEWILDIIGALMIYSCALRTLTRLGYVRWMRILGKSVKNTIYAFDIVWMVAKYVY